MNKLKITFLLLASVLVLLFSSCSQMMTQTDDVSIDLSSVISKAVVGGETINSVKVWLVAEGTNSFYDLGDEASKDLEDGATSITLTHIPVGPVYSIYMSLGEDDGATFTAKRTVTGRISVTGGTATEKTLESAEIKTSLAKIGTALNGVAFVNGQVYSTSDNELYYGTGLSALNTETAPEGFLFRDVDKGFSNNVIVSAKAANGQAIGVKSGSADVDFTVSSGLPSAWFGAGQTGVLDILSTFVFNDDTAGLQLGISQLDEGMILSVRDDNSTEADKWQWVPIPIGDALAALEEYDITIDANFFKGFSVMQTTNAVWVFIASEIGNFRVEIPMDGSDLDEDVFGGDANILDIFKDFVTNSTTSLKDRVVLNLDNADNDYLWVGTDSGLYKMTAVAEIAKMEATIFAEGERVELLKCSTNYTACVTPLSLIIINDKGETARVAFNEGLPVDPAAGLLNGESGLTGLDWNGDILYITGSYGIASLDVSELTFSAE